MLSGLASYTVLYTTTPPSTEHYQEIQHPDNYYEMDDPFPSAMHTDLKRDIAAYANGSNSSNGSNPQSNLPLFEKYQFLSSGMLNGSSLDTTLADRFNQVSSWAELSPCSFSSFSTLESALLPVLRCRTWLSARRWDPQRRRSNSSSGRRFSRYHVCNTLYIVRFFQEVSQIPNKSTLL